MKMKPAFLCLVSVVFVSVCCNAAITRATDPLPSWNDGPTKQAIMTFVEKVTTSGPPEFVPPEERIATFDNDGTLWAEKPMYFQLFFALDRVKTLAPQHPEWKDKEPFASLIKGDVKQTMAGGMKSILEIVMPPHTGMTTSDDDAGAPRRRRPRR